VVSVLQEVVFLEGFGSIQISHGSIYQVWEHLVESFRSVHSVLKFGQLRLVNFGQAPNCRILFVPLLSHYLIIEVIFPL
jgi:hypothetical protein